jgi:O-antigen/teichoic acid export membrane protein
MQNSHSSGGQRSLTHRTVAGVAWISAFQVARQVLQIISVSILARRVPPTAYGLMAMAVLVTNFLESIRDAGTGQALIREPEVSDELAASVTWLNLALGGAVSLVVIALSWPTAKFFHQPQLATILPVLALPFFLGALLIVPRAILARDMAFRELALAQTVGVVGATLVAIVIALAGGKVWSLVFATLANSLIVTFAIGFFSPFRLKAVFRWSAVRHIISFGMNLSGYQVLNYVSRNADNLLVGKFLGASPLGFYQMAYTLMTYPITNFTAVIGQVVYPALAKFHDDHERFRSAYLRTCRVIGSATFPLMLGLAVTAVPFVRVFLGERWMPVAPLLMIFGPLGALQSVMAVALIFNTQGRPDINFRWTIFASSMYLLSFIVGLHWGIVGVASAYSIVWTVLMVPSLLIPFRLVNLSLKSYFRALWPTAWMSLAMAAVCEAWLRHLQWIGVHNAVVQLISTSFVGIAVYVGLVLWRKSEVLSDVSTIVGGSSHPLARVLAGVLERFIPANQNFASDCRATPTPAEISVPE